MAKTRECVRCGFGTETCAVGTFWSCDTCDFIRAEDTDPGVTPVKYGICRDCKNPTVRTMKPAVLDICANPNCCEPAWQGQIIIVDLNGLLYIYERQVNTQTGMFGVVFQTYDWSYMRKHYP